MKKSIYLSKNLIKIVSSKLSCAGIEYEIKHQENGGTLYVESENVQKCSDILNEAREEEKKISSILSTLSCEIVNKEKVDLNNVPYKKLIGELVIVPLKKDGAIADCDFCRSIYQEPEDVLTEGMNYQRRFFIEKLDKLLREVMQSMKFEESYIDETLQMYGKDCPIWVLYSDPYRCGAVALGTEWLLKIAHDNLKSNFYILPSSKHEILIIPEKNATSLAAMEEMIQEVNKVEVSQNDILCNQVFYFDGAALQEAPETVGTSDIDVRRFTELYSIFMRLREI